MSKERIKRIKQGRQLSTGRISFAKQRAVIKLYRQGYTLQQIATETGLPTTFVSNCVKQFTELLKAELLDDLYAMKVQQTTALYGQLQQISQYVDIDGDAGCGMGERPKYHEAAVKIHERIAKLWGLDAPTKKAVEVKDNRTNTLIDLVKRAHELQSKP